MESVLMGLPAAKPEEMVFKGPQDLAASELEDLHGPEDEDSEAGAEARQSRVRDALVRQAHLDALFTVCAIMYRLARDGAVGAPMYLDTAAVAVTLSVFFLSRERYVNGVYSYVAVRSVTLVGALTTVKLLLVSASLQLQLSQGGSCKNTSALACAHKFWLSGYLFCSLQWATVSIPTSQAFFPELCRGALFVVLSIVASPAGTKATPVDIAVILAEALAGIVASLVLSALSGLPLSEPDDAVWQMCPRILRPLRHRILPLLEHGKGRFLLTSNSVFGIALALVALGSGPPEERLFAANKAIAASLVASALFSLYAGSASLLVLWESEALAVAGMRNQNQNIWELTSRIHSAEDAVKLQSASLMDVGRELRSALNTIVASCEVLRDADIGQANKEHAGTSIAAAEGLLSVANHALQAARLEANQSKHSVDSFDAGTLADDLVDALGVRAAHRGLELIVDVSPKLESVVLHGDATKLAEILTSLVETALKTTPVSGEILIRIEPEANPDEQDSLSYTHAEATRVRRGSYSVSRNVARSIDSHPEAAAAAAQRTQLVSVSVTSGLGRTHGGSGVGLILVRSLVSQCGGIFRTHTRPGVSNTHTAILPFIVFPTPAADPAPEPPISSGLTVVVALARPSLRDCIIGMIHAWGQEAGIVRIPEEATDAFFQETRAGALAGPKASDKVASQAADVIYNLREARDATGNPLVVVMEVQQLAWLLINAPAALHHPILILLVGSFDQRKRIKTVLPDLAMSAFVTKPLRRKRVLRALQDLARLAQNPGDDLQNISKNFLSQEPKAAAAIAAGGAQAQQAAAGGAGPAEAAGKAAAGAAQAAVPGRVSTTNKAGAEPQPASPLASATQATAGTSTTAGAGAAASAAAAKARTSAPATPPPQPAAGGDDGSIKVLVVEDNLVNQKFACTLLKRCGVDALTAENGKKAVGLVTGGQHKFDLILMDIQMPVMDGRTATSLIRKWEVENKQEPNWIVAITGNASMEDREECMRAGANEYLSKPVSRELIEQLLDDRVRQMGAVDFSPGPSNFAPAFSGGNFGMNRTGSSLFKDYNFARASNS